MKDLMTAKSVSVMKSKVEEAVEKVEIDINVKKLSKIIQEMLDRVVVDVMRDRDMRNLIKKAVKKRLIGIKINFDGEVDVKLPRKMDG